MKRGEGANRTVSRAVQFERIERNLLRRWRRIALIYVKAEIVILHPIDGSDRQIAQLDGVGEIGRDLEVRVRRVVGDRRIEAKLGRVVLEAKKIVEAART